MVDTFGPAKPLYGINMEWGETLFILGAALQGIGWAFLPILLFPAIFLVFARSDILQKFSASCVTLIDSLNHGLGELVKWGLAILVLSIAFSVFALSIFGLSWTKLFESSEYLHAGVIMLGAAATLLAGQHVRVDVFHTKMTPKGRALVDFVGFYVLLMPVCLIILWNSQSFVSFAWQIFEGSAEADGIRGEYLLKTLIPLFCLLMLIQGLAISLRAVCILSDTPCPSRPPHTPPIFGQLEADK